MTIEVDTTGILRSILSSRELEEVLEQRAARVVAEVENITPVRTGELRGDWRLSKGHTTDSRTGASVPQFTVTNTSDHAVFLEFGTKFMMPRAMLLKAVEDAGMNWPDHPMNMPVGHVTSRLNNRDTIRSHRPRRRP